MSTTLLRQIKRQISDWDSGRLAHKLYLADCKVFLDLACTNYELHVLSHTPIHRPPASQAIKLSQCDRHEPVRPNHFDIDVLATQAQPLFAFLRIFLDARWQARRPARGPSQLVNYQARALGVLGPQEGELLVKRRAGWRAWLSSILDVAAFTRRSSKAILVVVVPETKQSATPVG
ncbi:hypothetical protein EDB86DRAFT_2836793 [Lactarius hatsudake]|nr:hypothetical protein EDB86DRAFT_2836793 [Lactarius hatsudake]